jgi:hypothetical protein
LTGDGVLFGVCVGTADVVGEGVAVDISVGVGTGEEVGVKVGTCVAEAVEVAESVGVGVGVAVGVGVELAVGVGVGVGVMAKKLPVIVPNPFIVAVVVAELASLNVIESLSDDQLAKV